MGILQRIGLLHLPDYFYKSLSILHNFNEFKFEQVEERGQFFFCNALRRTFQIFPSLYIEPDFLSGFCRTMGFLSNQIKCDREDNFPIVLEPNRFRLVKYSAIMP